MAFPHTGYRFVSWTGDVSTIDNVNDASTTITMNGNYSITANFIAQYILTIDSTEGGHVTSPGEGTFKYDVGTVVNLVAEAEEGYKFLNWIGDIEMVANVTIASTTITLSGNCMVTAHFLPADNYLDEIGPGLWTLFTTGQGVETTVTDYGVVINITANPGDDPEAEEFMGGAGRAVEGDFDIRMGYELVTWPEGSGVRVGLSAGIGAGIPNKGVNIERVGWAPTEWPALTFREVYLVHSDEGISGITSTDDLSGTLRISRQGKTVIGYHSTAEGWHELYRAEWPTENVGIRIAVWSREYLFGHEEVSVLLRTVEFAEPLP